MVKFIQKGNIVHTRYGKYKAVRKWNGKELIIICEDPMKLRIRIPVSDVIKVTS